MRKAPSTKLSVTSWAMPGGHRSEYERRVNRVIDHIREHLAEDLPLTALAGVAGFSPFHFHRVFRAVTGETVAGFVQRLRIEKAAAALRDHPDQTVLAVALDHGFASPAAFARAFRARFGMTATAWRVGGAERWRRRWRKAEQRLRKPGKAWRGEQRQSGRMSVRVADMPALHVAFMRYVGPYGARGIPALWKRLQTWIAAHDLGGPRVTVGVAYDDPSITAPERCRYDACVVVPGDFVPDRLVDVMDVPGGRYAIASFVGTAHEIEGVWDRVFAGWLPGSGYEPDDRPCYELYRGDPSVDARATFRCELHLPVRRL
jgi:AraC family transcriptional regulator